MNGRPAAWASRIAGSNERAIPAVAFSLRSLSMVGNLDEVRGMQLEYG
jgi:hypothetical protein